MDGLLGYASLPLIHMHTHIQCRMYTAGRDYESLDTTLTFPANLQGGSRQCTFIMIIDDNVAEAEQSFYVVLTSETPNIVSVANNGGLTTVVITDEEGIVYL